jgi:methionyl-tRNA synthetase
LGNLINRVLVLAKKYDTELTVRPDCLVDESIHTLIASVDKSFSSFELFDACHAIHKISLYTNKYFDENKPWDKTLSSEARTKILDTVYTIVMIIVDSYQPIIPAAMARCREILLGKEPTIPFVKLG